MTIFILKLISALTFSYMVYSTLTEPFVDILPNNFSSYLRLALPPIGGFFMGWIIFESLSKVLIGNFQSTRHTSRSIATITSISYSNIRINNRPQFIVSAKYSGIEKTFDPIHSDIQTNFKIGDTVIVYHHPTNYQDSHLNIEESIKIKKENIVIG